MGIVNVTPDSFSDGGLYAETEAAVSHGLRLAAEGAAIIDVGGESTRPGSEPVPVDVELARVVPVVERLAAQTDVLLSIDTTKAVVARAALEAGAGLVNDVTALRGDPGMAALVAERGCPVCLMHMLGEPRTMQVDPVYGDVVAEVCDFLERRMADALAAGVREEQLLLDPGIGFGKTLRHNLLLLRDLERVVALGRPVVLGTSRKRFIGALLDAGPEGRAVGTAATTALGVAKGAAVVRVHDVRPNAEALRVAQAILDAGEHRADVDLSREVR
ncbi:MAG TPA: dihydropteroate synthase [Thermoleophilia bacterium]|nr:dihydropteroate synthase [Thermoleophilia bacterium]